MTLGELSQRLRRADFLDGLGIYVGAHEVALAHVSKRFFNVSLKQARTFPLPAADRPAERRQALTQAVLAFAGERRVDTRRTYHCLPREEDDPLVFETQVLERLRVLDPVLAEQVNRGGSPKMVRVEARADVSQPLADGGLLERQPPTRVLSKQFAFVRVPQIGECVPDSRQPAERRPAASAHAETPQHDAKMLDGHRQIGVNRNAIGKEHPPLPAVAEHTRHFAVPQHLRDVAELAKQQELHQDMPIGRQHGGEHAGLFERARSDQSIHAVARRHALYR